MNDRDANVARSLIVDRRTLRRESLVDPGGIGAMQSIKLHGM